MSSTEAEGAAATIPTPRGERLSQAVLSTPFLGAAIAIFTWPIYSIRPEAGPDPSWLAGLYMAHPEGLQFGKELVFTYGPLGFLEKPVLYAGALWMASFAYQSLIHVALAISLLWAARRALPLALALLACYVLLVVGYLDAAVTLLAFVWCLALLDEESPPFVLPLVVYGGGAVGAVELLGKANFGLAVLALCTVALLAVPNRRRNLPRFAAVALVCGVALWLLSGQSLANVPDFAANTWQVISGYSQAMGADLGTLEWGLPMAAAAAALLLAATMVAIRDAPWPRRLAAAALVVLFAYLSFKQDFVRQGPATRAQFFVTMLGAGIAVASQLPARPPKLPARSPALALLAALLALLIVALPTASFWRSLEPGDHAEFLREDLHAFLSADQRSQLHSEGRASLRASYGLDRETLRLLRGHSVHVDPWEIGVAWAYGLDWRPLPAIQDYQAYTPTLDRLNADALAGAAGPEAILRQNTGTLPSATEASIDDRYPGWESPAAKLAMLCHYRPVHTTGRWQVLERGANRCGAERALGSVSAETGAEIAVPAPPHRDDIVFARVHGLGVAGWEGLRSTLYRARDRSVRFDRGGAWRVVPATAGDGLILSAPAAVDYPPPFQLAPGARHFSMQIEGKGPQPLQVEFFARRVGR